MPTKTRFSYTYIKPPLNLRHQSSDAIIMGNNCGLCGRVQHHPKCGPTAKLISAEGKLKEFSYPIRVSILLLGQEHMIICSSESMEFDEILSTMDGGEVLEVGELYFELPLRWRDRRLSSKDMAELAVKASVALSSINERVIGFSFCWGLRGNNVLAFNEKEAPLLRDVKGRGGHKFVAGLSAIVEE